MHSALIGPGVPLLSDVISATAESDKHADLQDCWMYDASEDLIPDSYVWC